MLYRIAPIWQRLKLPRPALFHVHAPDGDEAAEVTAAAIGSWKFIIGQGLVITAWMAWNTLPWLLLFHFDAFPFIFLNLTMSAEAAMTGPVLLIAANVSAMRDHKLFLQMQANQEKTLLELKQIRRELATVHSENAAQRSDIAELRALFISFIQQQGDPHARDSQRVA